VGKAFLSVLSLFPLLISAHFPPAFILPFPTISTNPFSYAVLSVSTLYSAPLANTSSSWPLQSTSSPCSSTRCQLSCFNSLPPPRTKRFLYKSAPTLCKPGRYEGWREAEQREANEMGLVGAQSSERSRVSTATSGAAVTGVIKKGVQGRGWPKGGQRGRRRSVRSKEAQRQCKKEQK